VALLPLPGRKGFRVLWGQYAEAFFSQGTVEVFVFPTICHRVSLTIFLVVSPLADSFLFLVQPASTFFFLLIFPGRGKRPAGTKLSTIVPFFSLLFLPGNGYFTLSSSFFEVPERLITLRLPHGVGFLEPSVRTASLPLTVLLLVLVFTTPPTLFSREFGNFLTGPLSPSDRMALSHCRCQPPLPHKVDRNKVLSFLSTIYCSRHFFLASVIARI